MTKDNAAISGWWKMVIGLLIGALAPSLVAWGSMSAKIEHNTIDINKKVSTTTFKEYKAGNNMILISIQETLKRIEGKLDRTE